MLKIALLYAVVYFLKALSGLFTAVCWPFMMVAGLFVMLEEWQEDHLRTAMISKGRRYD